MCLAAAGQTEISRKRCPGMSCVRTRERLSPPGIPCMVERPRREKEKEKEKEKGRGMSRK